MKTCDKTTHNDKRGKAEPAHARERRIRSGGVVADLAAAP
jgi:hypothetical protein